MQFNVFAALAIGATRALTAATVLSPSNQCDTSNLQCCDSMDKATDPAISTLLSSLGIIIQDVAALITGITCSAPYHWSLSNTFAVLMKASRALSCLGVPSSTSMSKHAQSNCALTKGSMADVGAVKL
ncbi:hypothetical protein BDN70DRAFT_928032 [Pholiota conissans]|uniref:Hydrophobin n=1 Tax=Pholiota conissans TaxID=109636 RepID=A0A9P6CZ40_9AGAR|nr:hypothetical protein BDN70DRAFT_928032 [Pholiota conissans]